MIYISVMLFTLKNIFVIFRRGGRDDMGAQSQFTVWRLPCGALEVFKRK